MADPEPFLNGTRDIASIVGDSVIKPVASGIFTLLNIALIAIGVLLLAIIGLAYKHGPPKAECVTTVISLFRK